MLLRSLIPLAALILALGEAIGLHSVAGADDRRTAPGYDPLAIAENIAVDQVDLMIADSARSREIPIRIYLVPGKEPAPVILFSHGLGGSNKACGFLGTHWARRGYVPVFVQHPGSDESVWKDAPRGEKLIAMREAASAKNLGLRVGDIHKVIDQLELWNADSSQPLHQRLQPGRIGMSGHSFGAVTTQRVCGQSVPLLGQRDTDSRIRAAIAFSPSSPPPALAAQAFESVTIPWMLMTGTQDQSPIGDQTPESRMRVFPNLPDRIDRYELVLQDAKHSAFAGGAVAGAGPDRNPNHHRVILALSTAFWDAYLHENGDARRWLLGNQVSSLLEPDDRWQAKPAR